jgi:hypothetical protein
MQQLVSPPFVTTDPLLRRRVEKEMPGNQQIAIEQRQQK